MPTSVLLPEVTYEIVEELMVKFNEEYDLCCQVSFFDNKPWIRLSANVYNEKSDYVKLRNTLAKALKFEVYETESLSS